MNNTPSPSPLNYTKSTLDIKTAWFTWLRTNPIATRSVASFVAGYNAAINDLQSRE